MSTILDVLRKAQEDARSRSGRQRIDPGELPDIVLDRERPRRRFRPWMLAPVALVLLGGIAGGLFLTEGARVPRAKRIAADAETSDADRSPTAPATVVEKAPEAAPAVARAPAPVAAAAPVVTSPAARAATAPAAAPMAAAPAPVQVAAAPAAVPTPRAAATRVPVGRAAVAENPLADAPIGVPRPPAYLEKRIGPSGKPETTLLPVERPTRAGAEPKVLKPEPQERKRPLVRHADELAAGEARADAGEGGAPGDPSATTGRSEVEPAQPREAEPTTVPPKAAREPAPEVRRLPSGLPEVEVNIVQWSPAADRRFAFVRVDGSSMVKVREGDEVGGLLVVRIHPHGIELAQDDGRWLLRTD